jgi:hypothetical protein
MVGRVRMSGISLIPGRRVGMKIALRMVADLVVMGMFLLVALAAVPVPPGPGGNNHCPDPTAIEYC